LTGRLRRIFAVVLVASLVVRSLTNSTFRTFDDGSSERDRFLRGLTSEDLLCTTDNTLQPQTAFADLGILTSGISTTNGMKPLFTTVALNPVVFASLSSGS